MTTPDTLSSSSPSSRSNPHRFSAVRLPIEEPTEDLEDAVEKLKECSTTELHRARQHHRRALESLENGGYTSLSDSTRARLVARLRDNLEALNRALDANDASRNESLQDREAEQPDPSDDSFAARLRSFVRRLWIT